MIPFDQVEDYIGHAPSGVCPFAVKPGVKVYLDESLKRHAEVLPGSWLKQQRCPLDHPGSGKILRLYGLGGPDQDSLKEQRKEKQKTRTGWFAFSVM